MLLSKRASKRFLASEISATDQEALELALVENLQRKDLSPFEEAEGYRTLTEKYGYTHDQVASGVGKSRTTITETLKLLAIPPGIQDLCRHADITAKSILLLIARAKTTQEMERLVQEIAEGNLDREGARLAAQSDDDGIAVAIGSPRLAHPLAKGRAIPPAPNPLPDHTRRWNQAFTFDPRTGNYPSRGHCYGGVASWRNCASGELDERLTGGASKGSAESS